MFDVFGNGSRLVGYGHAGLLCSSWIRIYFAYSCTSLFKINVLENFYLSTDIRCCVCEVLCNVDHTEVLLLCWGALDSSLLNMRRMEMHKLPWAAHQVTGNIGRMDLGTMRRWGECRTPLHGNASRCALQITRLGQEGPVLPESSGIKYL